VAVLPLYEWFSIWSSKPITSKRYDGRKNVPKNKPLSDFCDDDLIRSARLCVWGLFVSHIAIVSDIKWLRIALFVSHK
jgi:hypothetical protein